MREDQVRPKRFELFERLFHTNPFAGKESVSKMMYCNVGRGSCSQHCLRAATSFRRTLLVCREDHPEYAATWMPFEEGQNGPASADLDIVCMCANTQDRQWLILLREKTERKHVTPPLDAIVSAGAHNSAHIA